MMNIRTYDELSKLPTFLERYEYLKLDGEVGVETFGFDRYLNQKFYASREWKSIRREVILRDNGCDLGVEGYEIHGQILIHHMVPITDYDLIHRTRYLMDPNYMIATTLRTHNAIHYGALDITAMDPVVRRPNDMCPWKK